MTLPDERYRAVESAKNFLRRLLDRAATPRVPKEIRREAYYRLKHYPTEYDMKQTREKLPKIWGKK